MVAGESRMIPITQAVGDILEIELLLGVGLCLRDFTKLSIRRKATILRHFGIRQRVPTCGVGEIHELCSVDAESGTKCTNQVLWFPADNVISSHPLSVWSPAIMNAQINAAILGVVQGLTEFLPVSSSGHIEIAEYLLGSNPTAGQSMLMTVVLHFATALSTVVVFRNQIVEIFQGLFQFQQNEQFWFCVKILLSMIPAVCIGLLFEEELDSLFNENLLLVGLMLVVTGILLFLADRARKTEKSVGITDSVIIGLSQAVAILPGVSRSGATISTSVLLGIDREKAARFSFLMVIPLIFGKMAKEVYDAAKEGESLVRSGEELSLLIGFAAAFFTGVIACRWMIQLVKASKLTYFSIYCFIVAVLVIVEHFVGLLR